ncbi:MAG: hypothetical protein QGG17_07940 [Rhodospirillales bacterium]|jgi:hypothetical protein|nr:hypothetical protein [Rhodospirillales bacterium]MDP6804629.1 hypothetical protein [Rhodospirillales bacterium]
MKRVAMIILAGLGVLTVMASAVDAQTTASEMLCSARPIMVEQLQKRFAEVPVAMGLQSNGTVLEVFASQRTNTWSIVITTPTGVSCLVSEGQSWESMPQLVDGPVS